MKLTDEIDHALTGDNQFLAEAPDEKSSRQAESSIPLEPAWHDVVVASELKMSVRTLRRLLDANPGHCEWRGRRRFMTKRDIDDIRKIMRGTKQKKWHSRSTNANQASTTYGAPFAANALTEALARATRS